MKLTGRVIIFHHGTCMDELEGVGRKLCVLGELLADNSEFGVRWWECEVQSVGSMSIVSIDENRV